jgi:hypothetical protein
MPTPTHDDHLAIDHWFKSSYSNDHGGACLEAAHLPNRTLAVRDSKSPDGPALTFAPTAWVGFTIALTSRTL